MITITGILPTSLITHDNRQQIILSYETDRTLHAFLSVYRGESCIAAAIPLAFTSGTGTTEALLPLQEEEFDAVWVLTDKNGTVLSQITARLSKPREWTLYIMVSSHTDIGLHNSQYIQRFNSAKFIDQAIAISDETAAQSELDQYRYTMEGTWFWNNYGMDRGTDAAKRIVKDYIKTGKLGACAGIAGNHFQTFGLEEMCRSTYERRRLSDAWDVQTQTLAMIDNNGLPMSMIDVYAEAGYQNIIFAPNHWNPLPSTIWKNDRFVTGPSLNPDAGGGGSRIDVRYSSTLPMVFNWESESGKSITIWSSTQYGYGGDAFGIHPVYRPFPSDTYTIEQKMGPQLHRLEQRYPYDIWLFACYDDDQVPDRFVLDQIKQWNAKWKWPQLRMLGDPNEPFNLLRERFGDQIPTIRGDITGGWYQHPLTVPELIAQKYEADRQLPIAEKWASVAGLTDPSYTYPATAFRRAWDYLLFNDEHSYGTSGYQGRKVYETWLQHRDWIEKATETASSECGRALRTIASHIPAKEDSVVVFNPMAQKATQYLESADQTACALVTVPPFGYRTVKTSEFTPITRTVEPLQAPPVIENQYYTVRFAENGSIVSIFDKELQKELVDPSNPYRVNELIYTKDNHQSFAVPTAAAFERTQDAHHIRITVKTQLCTLGAEIVQTITLPSYEKRIDIENDLFHIRAMINARRYHRYLYCAFPFLVENSRRLCHLNGTVAEYAKDITGHGTDVYMAAQEWCCAENDDFGVALFMKEHQLTEFDHIHPDKTDFANAGEGSQIFTYLANDWLQMHTCGGSHLDFRFRYSITSYTGGYRKAELDKQAERFVTPIASVSIPPQNGDLPADTHRFLPFDTAARFLCLKRADDGSGLIARFYGDAPTVTFAEDCSIEVNTVDERPTDSAAPAVGFATYRLGKDAICLQTREPDTAPSAANTPAPIGSRYTGLITEPRACAGEGHGRLYLLWGANTEPDLSHYALYRSAEPGFVPDDSTFLCKVEPEEYCVGRYIDTELADHTCYYYRVCAVNQDGICGAMSREFSAYTREDLYIEED